MSHAQTRAEGKAFRLLLGWLMQSAGFAPTPAEEMDEEIFKQQEQTNMDTASAPTPTHVEVSDDVFQHVTQIDDLNELMKFAESQTSLHKNIQFRGIVQQRRDKLIGVQIESATTVEQLHDLKKNHPTTLPSLVRKLTEKITLLSQQNSMEVKS